MKIALWCPASLNNWGGGTKWTVQVAHLLEDHNHNVAVYAFPYSIPTRLSIDAKKLLNDIPYTESKRVLIDADLTYVMYNPYWRLCKIKGKKIAGFHTPIFYSRNFTDPKFCIKYFGSSIYWFAKLFYQTISKIDLQSFDGVHIINPAGKVPHKNTFFIPNWIDSSVYRPVKPKLDKFSLLFVLHHSASKGWDLYLNLVKKITRMNLNIDFYATGESFGYIKGLGFVQESDFPKIYSMTHAVIYPGLATGFPLTFLEALSCGTPVITTPIDTNRATNLPLLYATNTDENLKHVLSLYSAWSKNRDKYLKISEHCRKSVRTNYDINIVYQAFESMLSDIMG